jgi:uncharacterized protein YndB with AHSA1/START domain
MSFAAAESAQKLELTITRVFDAPRALVWQAWTDSEQLMQWWGPEHHPATHLAMDVRPGGVWRNCLRSVETGNDLWHHGTFREVVPLERLVFTFTWEESGERGMENLVTITFADEGRKTRMTLHQTPFQSVAERDDHGEGWLSSFGRLETYLGEIS